MEKYALGAALQPLSEPLKEWTGRMFQEADALIFIGACGIAVRSIAPFVIDKKTDPAVVVIDEQGKICGLSSVGTSGGSQCAYPESGGNSWRGAGDHNGYRPADKICGGRVCKKESTVSLRSDAGEESVFPDRRRKKKVGFYSEFPCQGDLPEELEPVNGFHSEPESVDPEKNPPVGICVSLSGQLHPFPETLHLIPQIVTVGIGCRKGTPKDAIRYQLEQALEQADVSRHALCRAASINLKAEETGILELCREYGIPFVTISADELKKAPGDFTPSAFVEKNNGSGQCL